MLALIYYSYNNIVWKKEINLIYSFYKNIRLIVLFILLIIIYDLSIYIYICIFVVPYKIKSHV